MSIESNIIRSNVQKTSLWSGGKTTEIFIYPETAEYGKRDFDCRISTATVEVETSTFTPLPGIERHLLILEGELKIKHDEGEWICLKPYITHSFGGGQNTISEGKVRDFNVMVSQEHEAMVEVHELNLDHWVSLSYNNELIHFIYCTEGTIQVQIEQKDKVQRHFLYEGDGFFLEKRQGDEPINLFQMKALKGSGKGIHVVIKRK